jgi:hypothetical protein
MLRTLQCAVATVRRLVDELEPDRFDGATARAVAEAYGELERLGAAGKALAARQVVATGAWRQAGPHRDAAAWLADATGSTVGAARATLDASARLAELPATEAAWRSGELSSVQVDAIAGAASVDPGAEVALLDSARHDGVRGLRVECERVKAAACTDESARDERVRAARSLRHWVDAEGAGRIGVCGPPDAVARVLAWLAPRERRLFDEARKSGRRERADAIAFDALVAATTEPTGGVDTTLVVRVDRSALERGSTEPGELCEIPGMGPIPVHVASRLLDDAFVKAILVDGTDVLAVSHPGRTIPARLRTAIEDMYQQCVLEGCDATEFLEIDHNEPREKGGPTAKWNLGRLCPCHHDYKHRHDLRLVGEGTRRRFVTPDDPDYLKNLKERLC